MLAGAAVLLVTLASCAHGQNDPAQVPPASARMALVYRGPATGCEGCSEAVADLLSSYDAGLEVAYVGPQEDLELTEAVLSRATVYAHPGGNISLEEAVQLLGPQAASVITSYVEGGGNYLGFCLGAYLAGSEPGLGLLAPGNTGRYVDTPEAQLEDTEEGIVRVRWKGQKRWHFAQDPSVIFPSGVEGEQILSRFDNGEVNALVRPYGEGMVGVVGTHPEADRSWYADVLWQADLDGIDAQDGRDLIAAVLRE